MKSVLALSAALAAACTLCPASERRQTPLVRAVERAKASVINIHSEKTTRADGLFPSSKPRKVNGMGTGIVVDERGYQLRDLDSKNGTFLSSSSGPTTSFSASPSFSP